MYGSTKWSRNIQFDFATNNYYTTPSLDKIEISQVSSQWTMVQFLVGLIGFVVVV